MSDKEKIVLFKDLKNYLVREIDNKQKAREIKTSLDNYRKAKKLYRHKGRKKSQYTNDDIFISHNDTGYVLVKEYQFYEWVKSFRRHLFKYIPKEYQVINLFINDLTAGGSIDSIAIRQYPNTLEGCKKMLENIYDERDKLKKENLQLKEEVQQLKNENNLLQKKVEQNNFFLGKRS